MKSIDDILAKRRRKQLHKKNYRKNKDTKLGRNCGGKKKFPKRMGADAFADVLNNQYGVKKYHSYWCEECRYFHVGG